VGRYSVLVHAGGKQAEQAIGAGKGAQLTYASGGLWFEVIERVG